MRQRPNDKTVRTAASVYRLHCTKQKGGCLGYFVNLVFDLKQPGAKAMASGHTLGVRLIYGTIKSTISYGQETEDMQQAKPKDLIISPKKYTHFFLHDLAAIDINPIGKIIVTGVDRRHCSTTFYQ